MKFDDLDEKMRVYETAHDICVLPGIWIVVRLDGRGFTKFTSRNSFEKPFDLKFRDAMVSVTTYLIEASGFNIIYGYTESDEISLLFAKTESSYGRKERKFNSILAGLASSKFTQTLNDLCAFDSRVSQLPGEQDVIDYFRWRQEDAHRNALNGYCYWKLRQSGESQRRATSILENKGVAFKNELLYSKFGLNFNDVPVWQRRGIGVYRQTYTKEARNLHSGESVTVERRRTRIEYELPLGEDYQTFLRDRI